MFDNHSVSRPPPPAALPRLRDAIGQHWGGLGRVIDVGYDMAAFGVLAGLPALIRVATQVAGYVLSTLRRASAGAAIQRGVCHASACGGGGAACLGSARRRGTFRIPCMLLIVGAAGLLALQGCAPVVRLSPAPPAPTAAGSPDDVRTMTADQRFEPVSIESLARRAPAGRAGDAYSILALSGGGADGAFGAGALVGLTRSGTRPSFAVVTGVSAGALLAVYAFVGPEWDPQLMDAYTSGRAEHLLQPRGLGVVFDSSVYRGRPLEQLVDHYLTDDLLQAVAHETAAGRLLLVATTNVDTGETVLWDLGSIALHGGAGAKALFREILVASASVPGMFPPVIIRIQDDWGDYSEAHVDGTATLPFFVPAAFLQAQPGVSRQAPPTVYVLLDGRLSEEPEAVRLQWRAIMSRSISAGLTHMARTTLALTATSAQLQGARFEYSAIPVDYPNLAPFDFRASTRRPLFQYGYDCARAGRLWIAPGAASAADDPRAAATNREIRCPLDDAGVTLVKTASSNSSPW